VVVYAYDHDQPDKRDVARALLAAPGQPLVVSAQVLAEFYWVATRRLRRPISEQDAAAVVHSLAELTVVGSNPELVKSAIVLAQERQLALWDAMIVRAAQLGHCERLLSEDFQHGARFDGVTVENPFASLRT
jgi:predicted nucleic acid-binding protein